MKGTLSLAGELLKVIKTFTFAKVSWKGRQTQGGIRVEKAGKGRVDHRTVAGKHVEGQGKQEGTLIGSVR